MLKVSRILSLFVAATVASLSCFVPSAMAHVQATSNGISAVMHILPDDNPVAAKQTLVQFTFGGSTGDLDTAKCDCTLQVRQASETVSTYQLKPLEGSKTVVTSQLSFPKEGVYDLVVAGNAAKQFSIQFVVRVDAAGGTANVAGGVDVIFVSVATLVIVAVLGYYAIAGGGRYTTRTTSK